MPSTDERSQNENVGATLTEDNAAWARYCGGNDPFVNNGDGVLRRLKAANKNLFSSEEKMQVDFLDVVQSKFDMPCEFQMSGIDPLSASHSNNGSRIRQQQVSDLKSLETYQKSNGVPHTRFM